MSAATTGKKKTGRPRRRAIPAKMLDGESPTTSANDIEGYLRILPDLALLTADQEKELGRRVQKCDEEAKQKLIMHNTRLVVSEALKFVVKQRVESTLMDLVSEGMFGLFEAAKRFDPGRGCKFSTYAVYWIRCYLFRTANQNRIVRVPRYMHDILAKIPWAWCKLSSELGRDPSQGEMADLIGCTISEYRRTVKITSSTRVVSVVTEDRETGAEKSSLDYVEDHREKSAECQSATLEESEKVWRVIDYMCEMGGQRKKEAQILMMRNGFGAKGKYTLNEIGELLKLSRERVRQLEASGLENFTTIWIEMK